MMIPVGTKDASDQNEVDQQFRACLDGDGRVAWTGTATLARARFTDSACLGGSTAAPFHAHLHDLRPASEWNGEDEVQQTGTLKEPRKKTCNRVGSQTAAALSAHHPVVIIQGAPQIKKMKKLMQDRGA
jgi:hypothetical protein